MENKEKSNKEVLLYCSEEKTFENSIAIKFLEAHIKKPNPRSFI